MKALLISCISIAAVVALGACGPQSEPAKKTPPPGTELETIALTIEGMS